MMKSSQSPDILIFRGERILDPKSRVIKTLSFTEPDRAPFDYWAEDPVTDKLMGFLNINSKEELLKYLGIDFRYMEGPVYCGPDAGPGTDGSRTDIWGVRRKRSYIDVNDPEKGSYEHVVCSPLSGAQSVADIENYPGWPSPDLYDYSNVCRSAEKYPGYSVVFGGGRLSRTAQLKTAMYLRGVEQTMLDLALNADMIEAMNERLVDFFLEYNRRIFKNAEGKIDIFFMGDDFGTQNGLMMSIGMWRKLYKPGFRKFIELAHSYGIKVMHHTCGAVEPLIPDFIECGLDILQSLQPLAKGMDPAALKQKYGRHICFQGGIDIQHTMPFGSTGDVCNEVKRVLKTLSPGGGYILCTAHNIQADTPVKNIIALYAAAKEYFA
jgi:uroporphyrinogen decarboxylase